MVTVAVAGERTPDENRVGLVPENVKALARAMIEVRVERGAGARAGLSDEGYAGAGAVLEEGSDLYAGAEVVVKVRRPTPAEAERLPDGCVLIGLLQPSVDPDFFAGLASRGITCLALERVPRITRAQSMDVLSSQSTVAGYKAVLIGAVALDKFLPMLTTAAGSIAPGRCFVIGAGVAGLQAIATARRLGAVVSAFDIRPAAAEQVESLGAVFVGPAALAAEAETSGGYAREQSQDQQEKTLEIIGGHLPAMDLVICTAQIPGKPAPRLVTSSMVEAMRPGSVIVDLAAETGGNCELTRAGETVVENGVQILGPVDLASTVALHASQMFGRNVSTLLEHLIRDGELRMDPEDEIVKAMTVGE